MIMCTEWYPHSHGNFMLCVHPYNVFRLGFFQLAKPRKPEIEEVFYLYPEYPQVSS